MWDPQSILLSRKNLITVLWCCWDLFWRLGGDKPRETEKVIKSMMFQEIPYIDKGIQRLLQFWLIKGDKHDLQSPDLKPIEHLWDVVCIPQICKMLSYHYGPAFLKNAFSTLLNQCHRIKAVLKAKGGTQY